MYHCVEVHACSIPFTSDWGTLTSSWLRLRCLSPQRHDERQKVLEVVSHFNKKVRIYALRLAFPLLRQTLERLLGTTAFMTIALS
ncbi:hypothetical protein Y032_0985g3290 [Ancylostoma ceylanicum]|uniref:Uncharacterized protein n=1 Tax=Ancylostoma ceylanicum TaxID=53326 RepID=A0A016W835_9BILA|nr:hypothetical protein Y032_0985g3290 [Ancylostoma ceylanicum]